MSRIIPTVGRIVYYYTAEVPIMGGMAPREGPFAAIVTRVHSETCIDLHVFYPGGNMVDLLNPASVCLQQEGDRPAFAQEPYAAWMPYQVGQAAKIEADKVPKPVYAALDRCEDGHTECTAATTIKQPAPHVTMDDIEASITAEYCFTADKATAGCPQGVELSLLTFCVLVLKNGFTVTGESACVSPENFDADKGREIARKKAIEKIWPLMGYALKDRLAD